MLEKPTARAAAKARRAAIAPEQRRALSAALANHAGWVSRLAPDAPVAGFLSIGDEIDLAPLMRALSDRGHLLSLPVMRGRGQPLLFRSYRSGDVLAETTWGIREPLSAAGTVLPDLLLVPAGFR
jgi:5-formyltetrahydrofolate cyclo-ligase